MNDAPGAVVPANTYRARRPPPTSLHASAARCGQKGGATGDVVLVGKTNMYGFAYGGTQDLLSITRPATVFETFDREAEAVRSFGAAAAARDAAAVHLWRVPRAWPPVMRSDNGYRRSSAAFRTSCSTMKSRSSTRITWSRSRWPLRDRHRRVPRNVTRYLASGISVTFTYRFVSRYARAASRSIGTVSWS